MSIGDFLAAALLIFYAFVGSLLLLTVLLDTVLRLYVDEGALGLLKLVGAMLLIVPAIWAWIWMSAQ